MKDDEWTFINGWMLLAVGVAMTGIFLLAAPWVVVLLRGVILPYLRYVEWVIK